MSSRVVGAAAAHTSDSSTATEEKKIAATFPKIEASFEQNKVSEVWTFFDWSNYSWETKNQKSDGATDVHVILTSIDGAQLPHCSPFYITWLKRPSLFMEVRWNK